MQPISAGSFQFERCHLPFRFPDGAVKTRWVPVGMPRVPDDVLDSVVFLHRQTEDAERSMHAAGTGFVVGYPCASRSLKPLHHYYAVSNAHVVGDAPVAGVRRRDGGIEPFGADLSDWQTDEDADVAAMPLEIDWAAYKIHFIGTEFFLAPADIGALDVGIGDDVFMVGHFVDHVAAAGETEPFARFGHISMMPRGAPGDGKAAQSFFVDMRSRAGFSGSPVFVYRNPGTNVKRAMETEIADLSERGFMRLLGIDWGGVREPWRVGGRIETVEGVSSMCAVTPTWKIRDLLERDVFVKQRKAAERRMQPPPIEEHSVHDSGDRGDQATAARRDEILGRMLATPPAPRKQSD